MRVWKWLKRGLWTILGLIVVLLVVVGGTLTWAFYHPKQAWEMVDDHILPPELLITWEKLDFQARWLGGWDFLVDFDLYDLEIEQTAQGTLLPFRQAGLAAEVHPFAARIAILNRITVIAPEAARLATTPSNQPAEPKSPFEILQNSLALVQKFNDRIEIRGADVEVAQFDVLGPEGPLVSVNQIRLQQAADSSTLKAAATARAPQWSVEVVGDLEPRLLGSGRPFVRPRIKWQGFGVDADLQATLAARGPKAHLGVQGEVRYRKEKLDLLAEPRLTVSLSETGADLQLAGQVRGIPGPLVRLDDLQATAFIPFQNGRVWVSAPSEFKIVGPVKLFFVDKDLRPPLEQACECKIPETLRTTLAGKIWIERFLSREADVGQVAFVSIRADSLRNKLIAADLAGDLKIERRGGLLHYFPAVDSVLQIRSYQGLRRFLDAKNVLIPAPLDVLEGTLTLTAKGPIEWTSNESVLPAELQIDLASKNQRVLIDTVARVRLDSRFTGATVEVKSRIQSIRLELPDLDPIGGLPRVAVDRRILRAPPKPVVQHKGFKVAFDFDVETEAPGAIRLITKYASPELPISVKIHGGKDKLIQGYVQTEPFDLVYLRRRVNVKQMRLNLPSAEGEEMTVAGLMQVPQTQYIVSINVVGSIRKPQIYFTSEPDLPQDEIISVLLYDRTSDQLIGADVETTGSFRAAVADRAIGLFGLWAFAATPIRSFSYNPVTKVYSASVQLADDLSAGVGTNLDEATHLELRKRVSRRWMLTASWEPATQQEDARSKLVLQWEKRF